MEGHHAPPTDGEARSRTEQLDYELESTLKAEGHRPAGRARCPVTVQAWPVMTFTERSHIA